MATDGQVDTNEGDNFRKGGKMAIPPQFLKNQGQPPGAGNQPPPKGKDQMAQAKTDAAKRRLVMMNKKKPPVGNFGGPGDGVHTKKTGK